MTETALDLFAGRVRDNWGALTSDLIADCSARLGELLLAPQTAAAKTAYVAGIYQACTTGSATLTHASNAAVDQTFGYVVVG